MTKKSSAALYGIAAAVGIAGVAAAVVLARGQPQQSILTVTASPSVAVTGQQVSINVNVTGTFTSFTLDFGDGQSISSISPPSVSHAYANPGVYAITATGIDDAGASIVNTTQVTITQSNPTDVGTMLTETESPSTAQINQTVTISGVLTRTDTGAGIPNEPVVIQSSPNNVNWTDVTTVTTDSSGNYSGGITFIAAGTFYTRSRFLGGPVV